MNRFEEKLYDIFVRYFWRDYLIEDDLIIDID